MQTLLISDLHLEDQRPDMTRALIHFLERHAGNCDNLYILGDLFEVWLGDDFLTETARQVAKALEGFAQQGSQIFFMHGNRDFLLGQDYANRCRAQILTDPHTLALAGRKALLMHGDTLCTEDQLYMDFRSMVRNPEWQNTFLSQTIEERVAFGKKARNQSQEDAKSKTYEILDVTPDEVVRVMNEQDVDLLIHGHTHRPARHWVTTQRGQCERIVLGDWHTQGWALKIDSASNHMELLSFPLK